MQLDELTLKKELSQGVLRNLYVFCGQEAYLKEYYLGRIIKTAVNSGFEAFNLKQLDGSQTEVADIRAAAEQMPLMGEYNCCVVRDLPLAKLNAAEAEELGAYIQSVPETTILIFYQSDEAFPPKGAKEDAGEKEKKKNLKEMFALFMKHADIVTLNRRTERELTALLCSGAKRRNCLLSPENARLMVNLCGSDLLVLLNEMEKLSVYAAGAEITAQMIETLTVKTLEATAFEIADNLFAKKTDCALRCLQILLEQKTPAQMILGSLIFPFVDIYRVKTAENCGKTTRDLMKSFSYSSAFRLEKAARNGKKISEQGIAQCLAILDYADMCLKSRSGSDALTLEETLIKLGNVIC